MNQKSYVRASCEMVGRPAIGVDRGGVWRVRRHARGIATGTPHRRVLRNRISCSIGSCPSYEVAERHHVRVAAPAARDARRRAGDGSAWLAVWCARSSKHARCSSGPRRTTGRVHVGLLAEVPVARDGACSTEVPGREIVVGGGHEALGGERHVPCAAAGSSSQQFSETWLT